MRDFNQVINNLVEYDAYDTTDFSSMFKTGDVKTRTHVSLVTLLKCA